MLGAKQGYQPSGSPADTVRTPTTLKAEGRLLLALRKGLAGGKWVKEDEEMGRRTFEDVIL